MSPLRRPLRAVLAGAAVLALVTTGSITAPAAARPADRTEPPAYSAQLDRAQPEDAAFLAAKECSEEPRDLPIHQFTDHRELGIELDRIERVSGGTVDVEQVGRSNRGREIWSARVGTGRKAVLITSEIHGNEKTGTDAILDLLSWLGTSESAKAKRWREALTIVAIPKMNPDGAELDRRGNDLTWQEVTARYPQLRGSQPAWNYYTGTRQGDDYSTRPGFDVNRDYNPDLTYTPRREDFPGSSDQPGWYITPESKVVRDVYRGLAAEFGEVDTYVDLHHQGACYVMPDDPDEFVTLSISGKFVSDPATTPGLEKYAPKYDLDYSKRLNVAVYNALQGKANDRPIFGNVTLYPQDLHLPGTGLGSFALNGSGTVLFEVRGQTQSLGQKYRAVLTRAVYIGLDGMLSAVASGRVNQLDPAAYDAIPPRGPNIGTGDDADAQRSRITLLEN
ncbi:Zinc carboxypeptidase [Amycolatopsis arida]|uniref:Zinc carboxypeptidase n=1 Tax=Amycolatopsis arida TaxID=587909 RepID=A0A1I5P813_9PSEU|nr:M14 family zinc carboxypeptidase [Amycolatopsis arida]TDX98379.1 zinc carboxypeptidase [Amycolatopsis arida]SFP29606.1 Zinc carboxypeptidase [Amycolatopsis arida]